MTTLISHDQQVRLLSEREVARRLGLTSQQFIDLTEKNIGFPGEVYLAPDLWAWVEHEVEEYIDLQIWRRDQKKAAWEEAQYQKSFLPHLKQVATVQTHAKTKTRAQ